MKGSGKTDQDFKVGILNEDRKRNTDSGQSGSSLAGTGEARLLFFLILFFIVWNKWTTETSFNKILLSSVSVLFTLQSNYSSEPDKRLGHSEILRAVKTDSTSDRNTSIPFSEDLNNMSATTEKKNAYSLFPHKE